MNTVRRAVGVAGLVLAVTLAVSARADACCTAPPGSFWILSVNDGSGTVDMFYNWDFGGKNHVSTNVDWPVTLVYGGNASVWYVKYKLQCMGLDVGPPDWPASDQWGYFTDDWLTGWEWRADDGVKKANPFNVTEFGHIRLYAPGDGDRFYNLWYEYWVYATTHMDKDELSVLRAQFGWSDTIQRVFARAGDPAGPCNLGWTVYHKWARLYNEAKHVETKTVWPGITRTYVHESDGWASFTWVK